MSSLQIQLVVIAILLYFSCVCSAPIDLDVGQQYYGSYGGAYGHNFGGYGNYGAYGGHRNYGFRNPGIYGYPGNGLRYSGFGGFGGFGYGRPWQNY